MTKIALSSLNVCDTLTRPSNLTSSLGSLAPQLHHEKHESIARNAKQRRNAHVPPPVVPLIDVHRPQVVRAGAIRTILTRRDVVRVRDIASVRAEELSHVFSTCAS
jgi:hypothetical protein